MNRQKCLRLAFYSSMTSGYFHFGNSHFFFPQLSFFENILYVFADSRNHNSKKVVAWLFVYTECFRLFYRLFCTQNMVKSQDKIFL